MCVPSKLDFIYINTIGPCPLGHRKSAATQCEASLFSLTIFHLGDFGATVIYAVLFVYSFSVWNISLNVSVTLVTN